MFRILPYIRYIEVWLLNPEIVKLSVFAATTVEYMVCHTPTILVAVIVPTDSDGVVIEDWVMTDWPTETLPVAVIVPTNIDGVVIDDCVMTFEPMIASPCIIVVVVIIIFLPSVVIAVILLSGRTKYIP